MLQKKVVSVSESWAENVDTLKGCFEYPDWGVLLDELQDINHNIDVISGYLAFCIDLVIPKKHGSNKAQVKTVQKLLSKCLNKAKYDYKCKIEEMF